MEIQKRIKQFNAEVASPTSIKTARDNLQTASEILKELDSGKYEIKLKRAKREK